MEHICTDKCDTCPECGKPTYYAPFFKMHSCTEPFCRWADHKITNEEIDAFWERERSVNG